MRVLIVNSGLRYGGAEKQIVELSKALTRRGHAVAIYTLTNDVPRLPELAGSGVEVVVDNKRRKFDPGVLRRLRRYIRSFAADVVHGFLFDGNIYSRVVALGTGVPVLNSERSDNYALRRSQVWPHRLTRGLADGLIANTQRGAEFARRLFALPPARVHVVTNGVNLAELDARVTACKVVYSREFFGDDQLRIACFVGGVSPSKDYRLALEVADQLTRAQPQWRVLFIGDAFRGSEQYREAAAEISQQYRTRVRERFEALNLQGRALFAGQRSDVPEIMAQCDVLFSTSLHEGFPNVVLEAMSVGLPVVSVDYSDIRQILPLEWQVVPREAPAMVQTMLRAAAERAQVAALQRQWVQTHATMAHAAAALERVYGLYVAPERLGLVSR